MKCLDCIEYIKSHLPLGGRCKLDGNKCHFPDDNCKIWKPDSTGVSVAQFKPIEQEKKEPAINNDKNLEAEGWQ